QSVAKDLGIDLDAFGASQLSDLLATSHPGGRTSLTDTLKAGLHGMAAPGLEGTTREQLLGDLEVGHAANGSAPTAGAYEPGEFELYAAGAGPKNSTGEKIQDFMTTPQGDLGKPGGWLVPANGDPAKDANSQFNPGTPSLADRMKYEEQKKRDDAAAGKDPTDEEAKKKADAAVEAMRKQIEEQKEKERKQKEEKAKQDKEKEEKEKKDKDKPADADKDKEKDKEKDKKKDEKKDEKEKDKETTSVDPDYVESSGGPLTPLEVEQMETLLVNPLQNFGNPLDHDQEPVNPGSAYNPHSDPTTERWTGDDLPSIGQVVTGSFEEPLRLQIAPVDPPQGGDGTEPGPPRNPDSDTTHFGDVD
ncbi:MAG: hypothetical protein ACXWFO_09435, partial [Candidatus Aminicenantales bacterium]